jgi:hypothetical protein
MLYGRLPGQVADVETLQQFTNREHPLRPRSD